MQNQTQNQRPMQFVSLAEIAAVMGTDPEQMAAVLRSAKNDDEIKRDFANFVHSVKEVNQ